LIRDQSIEVIKNGETLLYPWAGGLNNPQFSNIDFNEDGSNDLFIFDKSGNVILPFIHQGSPGEITFEYEPFYIDRFPKIEDWALLRDFNCDGFMDIYTYSQFGPGAMVYENNGQVGNEWFSIADSLIITYYEIGGSSGTVNIFISTVDLPAIYDVDDDGDLDIFTYQLQGSKVEFHKNFSVENTGDCDLDYEMKNRCWGYFAEDDDSEDILLGQNCTNVNDPQIADPSHHTGSTLLMLDINNDGFKELVMGDISYSSLTTVVNGGPNSIGLDSITSVDYFFPNTDESLIVHTFPASFYVDVNDDGINDFIAAPNAQFTSDNVNAVSLYVNNGENDDPDLSFEQEDFLQGQMIDVGEGAYPYLIDIDQDGMVDLLIGNRKKITDSLSTYGISYFKNTGTAEQATFNFESDDVFNISSMGVGEALYPSFMDLDGDNALDLILGNLNGELYFLINSANQNEAMDFPGPAFPIMDSDADAIDVGQLAKPFVFDLNTDGLDDIIIGERSGRLTYYENTGSLTNPEFTHITDTLGGVQSPGFLLNTGYSAPFFYTENDEITLILGSETGEIQYYTEISDNLDGNFELSNGPATAIHEGKRTSVFRYDLNNDSLADLLVGNYRGGVSFFKGDISSSVSEIETIKGFHVFPNPASTLVRIHFEKEGIHDLRIVNQLGQTVISKPRCENQDLTIDVSNLSSGQYIIHVNDDLKSYYESLILIK
jgi:hypothetical protein